MSDDAAKEAVEHLQNAALEMIRATRAFLDLAEDVVADPSSLTSLSHLIGDLAAKGRAYASPTPPSRPPSEDGVQHRGVQHIRVS
jgi:hypothetical protein